MNPRSIASFSEIAPVFRHRPTKIGFPVRSFSTSRICEGKRLSQPCMSSRQPSGRSCVTPPMRNQLGCMRPPVTLATKSKICSRCSNVKNTGVSAPASCANVPIHTWWLMMRNSSAIITRITCARSGTSQPSSFSTAIR